MHWTDRVFYDGKVYLYLDRTDTWTAHMPQALALKGLWDQEAQGTKTERIRLQEGCIKLMRELRLSEEQSGKCSVRLLRTNLVTITAAVFATEAPTIIPLLILKQYL